MSSTSGTKTFADVVRDEVKVINKRRRLVARGLRRHAGRDDSSAKTAATDQRARAAAPIKVANSGIEDERGELVPRLSSQTDVVGLACSGGGVRSAAFCLGVFQGLDSLRPDGEPQVFDAVDYLSTVSGGGYIGASLVTGLMRTKGRFPFKSKLDDRETPETQHIRDYSNYLAPKGAIDILVGVVAIVRGFLVNFMIFLAIILAIAAVTIFFKPNEDTLLHPIFDVTHGAFHGVFLWTWAFAVSFIIAQIGYAIIWLRPLQRERPRTTLAQRELAGRLFVGFLILCALASFLELQVYILAAMFDARHLKYFPNAARPANPFGSPLQLLVAAATALTAFGDKFIAVATKVRSEASWTGFAKRWMSRLAVYLAAIVVPLLLWITYLALCYWGIGWEPRPGELMREVPPHTPIWLAALAIHLSVSGSVWQIFAVASLVLLGLSILVTPNANSLHGYYRDRLSRAFLWKPDPVGEPREDASPAPATSRGQGLGTPAQPLSASGADDASDADDVDQLKLSSLKPRNGSGGWSDRVRFAPYLLINTAVNLEGSKYLNLRGRNADSFIFSPLFVGSQATDYAPTSELEGVDHNVDLGTAIAISGAAASANMGASTIKVLTFSLAALNIRLGYWLPNPKLLANWNARMRRLANIGPWYFAKETFGLLNEKTKNVYLTDGGHFDNLGLYELLKRRCKIIVVADAEADPPLNFESLVRLQRYVRIDLGVLVDLPWEGIRKSNAQITSDTPHGSSGDPARCNGPHVAIGRIDYGEDEHGVLIYIKASMSGDESDLICDYRRRNPDFPHETTLDQFFTEEQFEVYRALGFHATRNFFMGKDQAAMLRTSTTKDWPKRVRDALIRLCISADAVDRIAERQRDFMAQ
jgi:hypothetical protein